MASLPSGPDVVYVGMDTSVREIVCGVLRPGRDVPAVDRIPNDEESVRRLIGRSMRIRNGDFLTPGKSPAVS